MSRKKSNHARINGGRCLICGTRYTWRAGQHWEVCSLKCERELRRGVAAREYPNHWYQRKKHPSHLLTRTPGAIYQRNRAKGILKGHNSDAQRTPEAKARYRLERLKKALEHMEKVEISAQKQESLRQYITKALNEQLSLANAAILGLDDPITGKPVVWNNVQARLFKMFLDKALPDLKESKVTHEDATPLNKLSRAELEQLTAEAAARERAESLTIEHVADTAAASVAAAIARKKTTHEDTTDDPDHETS